MLTINIKYDIGDKFTFEKEVRGNTYIRCPFCNGSKKIQGNDKTVMTCPRCYGQGKILKPQMTTGEDVVLNFQVLYDTATLENFPDGPQICYQGKKGSYFDYEITGLVSEN